MHCLELTFIEKIHKNSQAFLQKFNNLESKVQYFKNEISNSSKLTVMQCHINLF